MTDIRETLKQEADGLERQLQADPRYLKLQQLRGLIALYEADDQPHNSRQVRARNDVGASGRTGRAPNPDRTRALELVADFLHGRTEPTKTSEILAFLELEDVVIEGASPVSNLSAMLSRSPLFMPHGRQGWTLEPVAGNAEPAVIAAPAPPIPQAPTAPPVPPAPPVPTRPLPPSVPGHPYPWEVSAPKT